MLLLFAGLGLEATVLVLRSPVVPGAADFSIAVAALAPALLPMLLPVALLLGVTVGLGRWVADGTWQALQATGVAGRRLVPPAMGLGFLIAALMLMMTHGLAPAGQRLAGEVFGQAASRARLVPEHFLRVGGQVLLQRGDESLFVFDGENALLARGRLAQDGGHLGLVLEGGVILGPTDSPWVLTFDRASMPLENSSSDRRIQLVERSTAELAELVARMKANGRDASYERTVLLKRWTLPLAALLLPLLALPLALRLGGRPEHILLVVLGYWVLVRVGDASSSTLGAITAAALPPGGLAMAVGLLWSGWRER